MGKRVREKGRERVSIAGFREAVVSEPAAASAASAAPNASRARSFIPLVHPLRATTLAISPPFLTRTAKLPTRKT